MYRCLVTYYTYILASFKNGTLYAGHTNNLAFRVHEHKAGRGAKFTRDHNVNRLVWYVLHDTREAAKEHEYRIKAWKRAWKIRLIEELNPEWRDLYYDLNK